MQALRNRVYALDWLRIYGIRLRGWFLPRRDREGSSMSSVYEALEQHRGRAQRADNRSTFVGLAHKLRIWMQNNRI